MRFKIKDYTSWHEYFAWFPVRVNDEWVWLERVYRKGSYRAWTNNYNPLRKGYDWHYVNSEFDIIKDMENRINEADAMMAQIGKASQILHSQPPQKMPPPPIGAGILGGGVGAASMIAKSLYANGTQSKQPNKITKI